MEGARRAGQDFAPEDWGRLLAGTAPVSPDDAILATIADVLDVAVEYFVPAGAAQGGAPVGAIVGSVRFIAEETGSGSVVNDGVSSTAGKDDPAGKLTEQDLLLGRKASRYIKFLCGAGFLACVGTAIFVLTNVPWDTRMPYDGKYSRDGSGIPMQIAMLPILAVIFSLWRSATKPDSYQMDKASRVVSYVFGTAIVLGGVIGQWIMGQSILAAGGYFLG
jgi:hypothetical protein